MGCLNKMTKTEKLKVLQDVANDVVNRNNELESREYGIDDVAQAIKALEIILVAIGARHEPVFVGAMNPEGSKPSDDPRSSGHGQAVRRRG